MLHKLEEGLVKLAELVGAAALVVLMVVVTVDVVGRGAFNKPLPWGTELLEVILAAMIFFTYPALGLRSAHITVDLIPVKPALQKFQHVAGAIFGVVLFAIITWCLVRQTIRAAGYGEGTPLLSIPLAGILGAMAALSALTAVAFLAAAIRTGASAAAPQTSVQRELEAL